MTWHAARRGLIILNRNLFLSEVFWSFVEQRFKRTFSWLFSISFTRSCRIWRLYLQNPRKILQKKFIHIAILGKRCIHILMVDNFNILVNLGITVEDDSYWFVTNHYYKILLFKFSSKTTRIVPSRIITSFRIYKFLIKYWFSSSLHCLTMASCFQAHSHL